jgi:hypothetical protein
VKILHLEVKVHDQEEGDSYTAAGEELQIFLAAICHNVVHTSTLDGRYLVHRYAIDDARVEPVLDHLATCLDLNGLFEVSITQGDTP